MYFSLPGSSGCIANAQFEKLRVFIEKHVDDGTLHKIDLTLPTPEQPVITRGASLTISL